MKNRTFYITVKIEAETMNEDITNDEIVQELNYKFSSFDPEVEIIDTEICGINE